MNRPIVILAVCFIIGILLSHFYFRSLASQFLLAMIIICALLLLGLALVLFFYNKLISGYLLLFLFVILGLARHQYAEIQNNKYMNEITNLIASKENSSDGINLSLVGSVKEITTKTENRVSFVLDKITFLIPPDEEKISFNGKILVHADINSDRISSMPTFLFGDRIYLEGTLILPPVARNPNEFNYRTYLLSNGIFGILYCKKLRIVKTPNLTYIEKIQRAASGMREYLRLMHNNNLPPVNAAFINGIVLGIKSELPEEIRQSFIDCSLLHILVVSGSNIAMVSLILYIVLKAMRLGQRTVFLFSIPLTLQYSLVVGLDPPTFRATIMAIILFAGLALKQDVDLINNLSLSALILLLLNPLALFTSSFQLSFLATISIILLFPIFRDWFSFRPFILQMNTYTTLSALIGLFPLTAYYFNTISLIGILANILVLPLVFLMLPIGFITGILYYLSPNLATVFINSNYFFSELVLRIVSYLHRVPFAYFQVRTPPSWVIAGYYLLLFWFIKVFTPSKQLPALDSLSSLKLKAQEQTQEINLSQIVDSSSISGQKQKLFLLIGLVSVGIYIIGNCFFFNKNDLEITFLDVGQGDCIYISFPDGKNMLIDGGPATPKYDAGKRIVVPFLRKKGVRRLNAVVVSHPDIDHLGGLISVIEKMPVNTIIHNGYTDCETKGTKTIQEHFFVLATVKRQIKCQKVARGDRIIGYKNDVNIEIINPPAMFFKDTQSDVNNNSIAMKLSYGMVTVLFTGDIEEEAQRDLLKNKDNLKDLSASILKMPHHGSESASVLSFLESVNPKIAIIQVGKNNPFGHPSESTLSKLSSLNILVYRTDIHGAVTLFISKKRIKIKTTVQER